MSMFSGLTNQISGWVANKQGGGQEGEVPAAENGGEVPVAAEGEVPVDGAEQAAPGGVSGMAQGFLSKAMAAKDGLKEKAGAFQPPNLQGLGNNLMSGVTNLIPGRKEEEVPTPPEPNPPSDMGGEVMEAGEEQYQQE